MKKLNNKGFMLTEILIVSVFVATTFTLLYINVIPLMGSYESYENYDTIDTKYAAYYMRKFLLKNSIKASAYDMNESYDIDLFCKDTIVVSKNVDKCQELFGNLGIDNLIITKFETSIIKKTTITDSGLKAYIKYMPLYSADTGYGSYQSGKRIIIKMHNGYGDDEKTVYYYGTIDLFDD